MTKFVCIVPSNRPEEFQKFFIAWHSLFVKHQVHLVVMWDLPDTPFSQEGIDDMEVTQLCWKDLTTKYIPTKTDMIRSFAFKWAYDNVPEAEYFLTLDDDVRPSLFDDIFEEYEIVFERGTVLSEYFDVGQLTTSGVQMRGFPYKDRKKVPVAVQYGGWSGVLDYDAATQISAQPGNEVFYLPSKTVPKGSAVTCCIMNCAWKREYTPIMWQLPMVEGRYNRVGDIWSGLMIKKTLDAVGAGLVINGAASVRHERASNVYNSLQKEAPSVWLNDHLWENLSTPANHLKSGLQVDMRTAYREVTDSAIDFFEKHDKDYAKHFRLARDEWMEMIR
jgi:hypothetical protein